MLADQPDNLTLEILRGIRADVGSMRDGLTDVRDGLNEVRQEMHAFRGEIREIGDDVRGLKRVQDTHTLRFDHLEEVVGMLRDSTMMALGYSVDAVERNKKMETRLSALTDRVEKLEKAK